MQDDLTIEELIRSHRAEVLCHSTQRITVRWRHILNNALRCGFYASKHISIHFLGESAINEGGPKCGPIFLLVVDYLFRGMATVHPTVDEVPDDVNSKIQKVIVDS